MKKSLAKNKKVLVIAIVALLVIVAVSLILLLGKKDKFRKIIVNDNAGTVELKRDQGDFEITKDMKLIPKDFVSVGDESSLDLLVDEDKHIAVRSSTKFSVDAVGSPKEGLVTINVTEGKSYIKIDNPLEPEDGFQVVTPNATISVRGTTFTVEYNPSLGITRVECVEGKVNVVSNSGDEIDLLAGDVVEVIDTMTTSTLTQQEMDAIVNVFIGGDSEENDSAMDEANVDNVDGSETEDGDTTPLICMTAEEIMQASVGDVVTYGIYPETPIEWIVLDRDGECVTLLSKYVLDGRAYHQEDIRITWENSDIRAWLNNDFYNSAFTETEKTHIQTTTCVNEDNPYYGDVGGNTTQDKVYLLSLAEIEQYFGVNMEDWSRYKEGELDGASYEALCREKSGGYLDAELPVGSENHVLWWLRSPGRSGLIAFVDNGGVYVGGGLAVISGLHVRPVIRIGL